MIYNKSDIIKYRLEKSSKTFKEAESLFKSQFYNGSINRLYYSCYHVVSALLLKNNIKASTHNGVRTQFFKYFIKTEVLNKKYSVLYSNLMNKRQESDYDDFQEFKKDDIEPLIAEVKDFIKTIQSLI